MSDLFEPGETAIWQNLDGQDSICNGQECVVTSGMQWGPVYDRYDDEETLTLFYEVRDEEGEWTAAPWELRKKRPPPIDRSELVTALSEDSTP